VVLHGATTAPVMQRLDRLRERRAAEKFGDEGKAPHTPV
jgi:sodium/hydrogen antiporter